MVADGYAREVLEVTPNDVFVGSPPVAFTFGLGGLAIFPLRFGATATLLENAAPPNMIEILAHPHVAECAVIGAADEERGQTVEAHVVLAEGVVASDSEAEVLKAHVKATIAPYKYPRSVVFTNGLLKTETGKIQRFRLKGG